MPGAGAAVRRWPAIVARGVGGGEAAGGGLGYVAVFVGRPSDATYILSMARGSDEVDETAVWWLPSAVLAVGICWFVV